MHRTCALLLLLLGLTSCQKPPAAVSGTIEVDEVHVAPRAAGRVARILVQEGDLLRAGQLLLEMDAAELVAQQGVAAAQINTAESDAAAQAAQLEFLRADAQRQQDLLKSKTVSPNEAERAASVAKAQEKTLEAARMRITQAQAQLAAMEAQLQEMKVVAPNDCVVEVLNVKVGDVISANREVATVILPQHLWVRVFVPEPWLGLIQLGEAVRVHVDSFRGADFNGIVEQINRQAEFTPRNVQTVEDRIRQVFGVKIRLENRDDKLRAGMSADVVFANVPK